MSVAWANRIVSYDPAVPLDQLLAHPQNPKIHPTAQTDAIKGILGEVGWLDGLKVNVQTQHVLDGHDRIKAAMQAGQVTAPVFYVDVPAEQEAYVLSTFDPVGALAATDSALLADLLADVQTGEAAVQALLDSLRVPVVPMPGAGGDEFDGTPTAGPTRVQPGDLWQIGPHRLLIADSTDSAALDQLMAGVLADMVFTDPPYGVEIVGGTHNPYLPSYQSGERLTNDDLSEADLETLLRGALGNAWAVCRPGAVWYVAAPPGPLNHIFGAVLKDLGVWRQTLNWVKHAFVFGRSDYHYRHEPLFYGWKEGAAHYFVDDRTQDTIWEFDRPGPTDKAHPTVKPLGLVERAISNSTRPAAIVLDVFGGAGTTLIAAHRTQRVCRMVEIDPKFGDLVLARAEAEGIGPIARVGADG